MPVPERGHLKKGDQARRRLSESSEVTFLVVTKIKEERGERARVLGEDLIEEIEREASRYYTNQHFYFIYMQYIIDRSSTCFPSQQMLKVKLIDLSSKYEVIFSQATY